MINMYILDSLDIGKLSAFNEGVSPFLISSSKQDTYTLSRFLPLSSKIRHSSLMDGVSYALILSDQNISSEKNSIINIQAGNRVFNINQTSYTNLSDAGKIQCKTLLKSDNAFYQMNHLLNGVIMTFRKMSNDNFSYNVSETIISGINGWMSIADINKYELSSYLNNGKLDFIIFQAPILELLIDNKKYEHVISSSNVNIGKAELYGRITEEGLLRYTGRAKIIYINEHRVNQSRWEKLDLNFKIILFGLFPGILIFALRRLGQIFNEKNNTYL